MLSLEIIFHYSIFNNINNSTEYEIYTETIDVLDALIGVIFFGFSY